MDKRTFMLQYAAVSGARDRFGTGREVIEEAEALWELIGEMFPDSDDALQLQQARPIKAKRKDQDQSDESET